MRAFLPTATAALLAVAGCFYDTRPSEEDVRDVAVDVGGPVYYVGMTFKGVSAHAREEGPEHKPGRDFIWVRRM